VKKVQYPRHVLLSITHILSLTESITYGPDTGRCPWRSVSSRSRYRSLSRSSHRLTGISQIYGELSQNLLQRSHPPHLPRGRRNAPERNISPMMRNHSNLTDLFYPRVRLRHRLYNPAVRKARSCVVSSAHACASLFFEFDRRSLSARRFRGLQELL